jgi:hypothetical protein
MKLSFGMLKNDKVVVLVILIIIVSLVVYRLLNNNNSHVSNLEEGFDDFSVVGNSLIDSNGTNLETSNFGMETANENLVLGNMSKNNTSLPEGVIKVELDLPQVIYGIKLKGMDKFTVDYRNNNNELVSVLHNGKKNMVNEVPKELLTLKNLVNPKGEKILTKELHIKYNGNKNSSPVQLQVYGLPETSDIMNELDKSKLIKETRSFPVTTLSDEDDGGYHLKLDLGDDHLVTHFSVKGKMETFSIKYENSLYDAMYSLPCGKKYNGAFNDYQSRTIYLDTPTLMNKLMIVPDNSDENMINNLNKKGVKVYGRKITQDKERYGDQSIPKCFESFKNVKKNKDTFHDITYTNSDLESVTNMTRLCSILENQDKIKYNNAKLEKNKQYYLKLQQQEEEIAELQNAINVLKNKRKKAVEHNDIINLLRYQQQDGDEAKVADLVRNRLKHQQKSQLEVDVNLNPV